MKTNTLVVGIVLFFCSSVVLAQNNSNLVPINYLLLLEEDSFSISSNSFLDGQVLDAKYTLYKENISPHLSWENAPTGTESFALTVYDTVASDFLHWSVVLPKETTFLAEGAGISGGAGLPAGSVRFNNDFFGLVPFIDGSDYDGPRPPLGSGVHSYKFQIDARDISNVTIATANLVGEYEAVADCNGVIEGDAYFDSCDICVGGNTGLLQC